MHTLSALLSVLFLFGYANAQIKGIWYWTWSSNVQVGDANLGVAFSGWVDPDQAIAESAKVLPLLKGEKYLSLGGGNANGHWGLAALQKIRSHCSSRRFAGYHGLAFDIEEGDRGLASAFEAAFATCKASGYKILVTVSHSAPYGVADAAALMDSFFASQHIDYFSPQLYTNGNEGSNDFSDATVSWAKYARTNLIPSVVAGNTHYPAAKAFFASKGITTKGFVQWSQTVPISGGSATGSSTGSTVPKGSIVRCGRSWVSANSGCGAPCKTNADCPGSACWADLSLNPCNSARAGADNSNTFTEATPLTGKELTPMQIGFIVGGCLIFAIIVVVVVIVRMNGNKKQESA